MKHNEIFTRPARDDDAQEIVEMHRALAEYDGYDMAQFAIGQDDVLATLHAQGASERYVIAETGNETSDTVTAGMIYMTKTSRSWTGSRGVYVEDLYVKPEFRHGRGVGTRLLGEAALLAIEYAGGDSSRAFLRLDTSRSDNDATLRFYESRGFEGYNINMRLGSLGVARLLGDAR